MTAYEVLEAIWKSKVLDMIVATEDIFDVQKIIESYKKVAYNKINTEKEIKDETV